MTSLDQTKKEALFNEVKGSLFEYLVARRLAGAHELAFLQTIDRNYLNILSQQDRLVRQFYPEMLPFLIDVSTATAGAITAYLKEAPTVVRLCGKFSNVNDDQFEADLLLDERPVSLKLNKAGAYVNTKSGGIKSFFQLYLPAVAELQPAFNQFVDQEFFRMSHELHLLNDLPFAEDFSHWLAAGKSELPGELTPAERGVLKAFYARVAGRMHELLAEAQRRGPRAFACALAPLMGFGAADILQVICFHEFKREIPAHVEVHAFEELEAHLGDVAILPFGDIASTEIRVGAWSLQVRVKPMNKFTTTAIKINCAVKFRPSSDA